MKKSFTLLLLGLLLLPFTVGNGAGLLHAADKVKPVVMWSPANYYIYALSPNGKWACGVYNDYSYENHGFRWNLESDEIEMLGNPTEKSEAWSITDDGTIAGRFTSHEVLDGGAAAIVPGIYKDGKWTMLELPAGASIDDTAAEFFIGTALAISHDGRYVSGSVVFNYDYRPYVWCDGKILKSLDISNGGQGMESAMPYCISPDGQYVGGWSLGLSSRKCTIWNTSTGARKFLTDYEFIYAEVNRFSPDGKKLILSGNGNFLYDIETETLEPVRGMGYINSISSNYTIVGTGNGGAAMLRYGSSTPINVVSYLRNLGADFTGKDVAAITETKDISADETVFALQANVNDGQGYQDNYSIVVKLNADPDHSAPVGIQTRQLEALQTVEIAWKEPQVAPRNVVKYIIERNGVAVGTAQKGATAYYDKDLKDGKYTYTVTSEYADGTQCKSQTSMVTVTTKQTAKPENLFVRQKGANNIYAEWDAPQSNFVDLKWHNPKDAQLQGFGIMLDNSDIEVGIGFKASEMSNYEGYNLTKVQFYPMSEQKEWAVRVYRYLNNAITPTLVHEEIVTQELVYGERNTVKLKNPVPMNGSGDMVVAIGVKVPVGNPNIVGIDFSHCKAGYSDLMRLRDEDDFYSYYDLSSSYGSAQYNSFMIDAILAKDGAAPEADEVSAYEITLDGKNVGTTTADSRHIDIPFASASTHTVGVSAVFGDGKASASTNESIATKLNFKAAENVVAEQSGANSINIKWQTPLDDDAVSLSYCVDTPGTTADFGAMGTMENNYAIAGSIVLPPSKLKGYDGYEVKSVKFYPTADAIFTVFIYENDVMIAEIYADDYVLNKWNTVELTTPIYINAKNTYRLAIDCYDCEPEKAPLAMDPRFPIKDISDAVSVDGCQSWVSVGDEGGLYGNWMIKMDIAEPEPQLMPVKGYDVYVDTAVKNEVRIQPAVDHETVMEFTANDVKVGRRAVRVAAFYEGRSSALMSTAKYVTLEEMDGIEAVTNNNTTQKAQQFTVGGRKAVIGERGIKVQNGKAWVVNK